MCIINGLPHYRKHVLAQLKISYYGRVKVHDHVFKKQTPFLRKSVVVISVVADVAFIVHGKLIMTS